MNNRKGTASRLAVEQGRCVQTKLQATATYEYTNLGSILLFAGERGHPSRILVRRKPNAALHLYLQYCTNHSTVTHVLIAACPCWGYSSASTPALEQDMGARASGITLTAIAGMTLQECTRAPKTSKPSTWIHLCVHDSMCSSSCLTASQRGDSGH